MEAALNRESTLEQSPVSENETGLVRAGGRGAHMALFALLLFCFTYVHQKKFDNPTPVSRLDLLHSIWTRGSVSIDKYHKNTPDKAVFEGRYYSDKAPGTVALALAPFGLAAGGLSLAGTDLDSKPGWLFSSWVACAGSIGLVTALGGVALFAWLSKHVPQRWALVTTLALFLGAAPLPYSTMMFSHALVIGLLCSAIWCIDRQSSTGAPPAGAVGAPARKPAGRAGEGASPPGWRKGRAACLSARAWLMRSRWDLLAGLACGWVLASEYSAGLVVAGLFLWLVSTSWRRGVLFCLGAAPPLLLIPAYSWACFGSPLRLPYSYQASFPEMQRGLYAIQWPNPETAFNLLLSPARGLLFWTPFLVLAGFGYRKLLDRSPKLFWLTYLVPVMHIVVISGRTWDWPAGPAWGPRLLSPAIPLLALPCAYGVKWSPRLGVALAAWSILVTTVATLTDACPNFDGHPNPLFDLNASLFVQGKFCPNLGTLFGLPSYVSAGLFYAGLIAGVWWLWRRLPEDEQWEARDAAEPVP
jgi:hypothetical protein